MGLLLISDKRHEEFIVTIRTERFVTHAGR